MILTRKFYRTVTLKNGRTPPSEFQLVPMGKYETTKGTFLLTMENAKRIMAQLADEGVDSMMDWEHESVAGPGGRTDAAGWFNVELRADGLWAVNVKWEDDAAQALSSAKYRYVSPAFTVDPDTGEIIRFINCALTNRPATKKATPLVAASRRITLTQGNPMKKKFLAALSKYMSDNKLDHKAMSEKAGVNTEGLYGASAEPSQEEMTKCAKAMGVELSAFDGQDPDDMEAGDESDAAEPGGPEGKKKVASGDTAAVPGEEKFEKLSKQFNELMVTLTGETNPNKAVGVLAAMKEKAMRYDEDHKALVTLRKERDEEKRSLLLEKGKTEGKLTPSLIKLSAKWSVEELSAFLDHAPVVTGAEFHQVEAGTPIALLSKADREVAMLLNRDPADVAKGIEAERAGKFEQAILSSYYVRPTKATGGR